MTPPDDRRQPTSTPSAERDDTLWEHDYRRIKNALPFDRHYAATLAVHALDAVLFGIGLWLVSLDRIDAWLAAQALFTLVAWHSFAIVHECGHSSASSTRWLNVLSGSWASLFCLMPYYPWKLQHLEHHRWTGHLDRDPTARGLRKWKVSRQIPLWIRASWRTWIPVVAVVQHFVFWCYPLVLAKRGRPWTAAVARCALSVALLPVAYTLAHLWSPQIFCLRSFAGALGLYMFLTELINLPHHADRPFGFSARLRPWEQWRTSRSCDYPKWFSELVLLNFNLHVEHHLFPTLPWYRLMQARSLVRPALGERYVEATGAEWNFRNRRRSMEQVVVDAPTAQVT